jgi:cell shape-determining protein MreC
VSVLDNFQDWKNFLSERVKQAENMGMNQDTIKNLAYEIGDYLAKGVEPKNEQERLLQDMWSVADPNEQRMMAGLMVKMVNDGKK